MSDGPLLVPAHLYAMVRSSFESKETGFFPYQPDYGALARFEPVDPEPFADAGYPPEPGVHVHWLIPRPLRHAPEAAFPLVPNRWLVVRVGTSGSAAAWVILSDRLGDGGASPYVAAPAGSNPVPVPTSIGHCLTLADYLAAPPASATPFLQAVRPGDATFTLFAPAARNVFAFHDPMTDVAKGTFAYHVVGWYSEDDPIAGVKWKAATSPGAAGAWVDQAFGFQAWSDEMPAPRSMLVHALLTGVSWDPGAQDGLAIPDHVQDDVTLAVGNTAVDALAAIVSARHGTGEASILQAFQYSALDAYDQPSSATVLDRAIRRHWFDSAPGGTVWRVVPPDPLTSEQSGALDRLNADQTALDRQSRILASMRTTLAGLWWKLQWLLADGSRTPPGMDRQCMVDQLKVQLGETPPSPSPVTPYLEQVEEQQKTAAALQSDVAADRTALAHVLTDAQQITAGNRPQYHAASDPVVLFTGLDRSFVLDPAEDPTCRFVTQLITDPSITVPPLTDPAGQLPEGVQELHYEAVVLASTTLPSPPPGPSTTGCFPPPPEAMTPWQQPWFPLLLDWQVTLLASPACAAVPGDVPVYAFDQAKWAFDGSDWSWAGPQSPMSFDALASGTRQLAGRTFITPQLPNTLAAQLRQYIAQHSQRDPQLAALLEQLAEDLGSQRAVGQQDILSQRLSGFRSLLAQLDPAPTAPPAAGSRVAAALGDAQSPGTPSPGLRYSQSPVLGFAPVAGTFFTIDALRVVDSMGQGIDVTYANHNPQPQKAGSLPELGLFPLAAPGVRTAMQQDPPPAPPLRNTTAARMLVLPPRLAQQAQVSWRLLTADGTDTDIALRSAASPVCGWLVPNHLDRSLSVYAADGSALGELAGPAATWFPNPVGGPADPGSIPNQYLAQMLQALSQRSDAPDALSDLLLTIDESLWTIQAGTPRDDEDLAVLVGRPLAVVRADLSLGLRGVTLTRQDWWSTFAVRHASPPQPATAPAALGADDGGLGTLTWPVRLGDQGLRDDGLIGLFIDAPGDPDATWSTFRAVTRHANMTSGFIKQIGRDIDDPLLRFLDDRAEPDPAKTNERIRMTMLLDPRTAVHAFTGLLPVTTLQVPDQFTAPALRAMSYLFRAGPILTPPDELRIPRPAGRRGRWSWFDHVLGNTVPVAAADQNATLPATPPRAVEGWLKLTEQDR